MKRPRLVFAFALLTACGSSHRNPNTEESDSGIDTSVADVTVEADATDPTCPPGPYGYRVGDTIPCLTFQGYRDGKGALTTISTKDYWDPDGSKGINVVVFASNAVWCAPCRALATWMAKIYVKPDELFKGSLPYRDLGARFASILLEDVPPGTPSDQAALNTWMKLCALTFDATMDPEAHVKVPEDFSFPYTYIVDPATMRIQKTIAGFGDPKLHLEAIDFVLGRHGKFQPPPILDAGSDATDASDTSDGSTDGSSDAASD